MVLVYEVHVCDHCCLTVYSHTLVIYIRVCALLTAITKGVLWLFTVHIADIYS